MKEVCALYFFFRVPFGFVICLRNQWKSSSITKFIHALISLDKPKPFVSYRFPPAQFDTNKDNMANAIVQFCFPEAEQWMDPKFAQKKKEEKYIYFLFSTQNMKRRNFFLRIDGIGWKQKIRILSKIYCPRQ